MASGKFSIFPGTALETSSRDLALYHLALYSHLLHEWQKPTHKKIELKLWDTTRSQESHEELISQRLQPTSVMEWCTIRHLCATEVKNSQNFYSVPVESTQSYLIRSHRSMDGYCAGLDGPQAAWACRKYHGHRTLPPEALWEARAHAWIGY